MERRSWWAQCDHLGSYEREGRSEIQEKRYGDGAEVGVTHFEDGGRGHEIRRYSEGEGIMIFFF